MPIKVTNQDIQIPDLATLFSEYEKDFQTTFQKPDFRIEDDQNIGQVLKIVADRENKVNQAVLQGYQVKTLNGAEAVFLDELFALRGIFREGKTKSAGVVVVETDTSTTQASVIPKNSLVSASNGNQYKTTADTFITANNTAFKITTNNLPLKSYQFSGVNRITGIPFAFTATLAANTDAAKLTFLEGIKTNLTLINPLEPNLSIDQPSLTLRYGIDVGNVLVGLVQSVDIVANGIGNHYTQVPVEAVNAGYFATGSNIVTSMSPTPSGFVDISNPVAFSTGKDIETDAAFIERANALQDQPRSSTAQAIRAALLREVSGVETVVIHKYINPTENDRVEVTPIIIGGDGQKIAEVLENVQPINNVFYGNQSYTVATADGDTEVIRFSRGVTQNLNVRISYTTDVSTILSQVEQDTIKQNLLNFSQEWKIGTKIFNAQLMSAVFSGVVYGRFTTLKVEVKPTTAPDTSYSSADYQSAVTELPSLLEGDIIFSYGG